MNPKQYRKKPVVIDAIQYTGNNYDDICLFVNQKLFCAGVSDGLRIPTLEGEHIASVGDWIIKGVKGEFYPCKPDIFAATYEPASTVKDAPEVGECKYCAGGDEPHLTDADGTYSYISGRPGIMSHHSDDAWIACSRTTHLVTSGVRRMPKVVRDGIRMAKEHLAKYPEVNYDQQRRFATGDPISPEPHTGG